MTPGSMQISCVCNSNYEHGIMNHNTNYDEYQSLNHRFKNNIRTLLQERKEKMKEFYYNFSYFSYPTYLPTYYRISNNNIIIKAQGHTETGNVWRDVRFNTYFQEVRC